LTSTVGSSSFDKNEEEEEEDAAGWVGILVESISSASFFLSSPFAQTADEGKKEPEGVRE
jgi:hypothetical protein